MTELKQVSQISRASVVQCTPVLFTYRVYGIATCGVITCPQPTNLVVSPTTTFTWTAGGTETQWEVFVQAVGNNTLPQSGTIVDVPTYTPTEADFNSATASTYEYFVRAICGADNKSFWSGPKVFVRNDDASKAFAFIGSRVR